MPTLFDEQIFSSRSSQIKVSKVQDAWYYSKRRNPIGIKISFNLEVPTKGAYDLNLALEPASEFYQQVPQKSWDNSIIKERIINIAFNPPLKQKNITPIIVSTFILEPKIIYRVTFYTVPAYLIPWKNSVGFCLWDPNGKTNVSADVFNSIVNFSQPIKFQWAISSAALQLQDFTNNFYNLKTIYQGIQHEGFPPCSNDVALTQGDLAARDI